MFVSWIGWIGAGVMALVCTFALLKGERIERIGATAYLMAWLLTTLISQAYGDEAHGNWIMLLVDVSLLAAFVTLIWKAPRNWPVWASAFQALIVASQILILARFDTPIVSYYRIVNVASYGILIALAIGTFIAWQESLAVRSSRNDFNDYS